MKHRALVIGAGRIGAGFNWHDDEYTHAGAYRALSDRVELVGFVEPDLERRVKANLKWNVPTYDNVPTALEALKPDIVSVCVQPHEQKNVFEFLWDGLKGVWCEKPFMGSGFFPYPIQVNYLRRGSRRHRAISECADIRCDDGPDRYLFVTAKDDIHTRCHFEDLARWWKAQLVYTKIDGPNSYFLRHRIASGSYQEHFFSLGGVDGGECMRAMLKNLLDYVDTEGNIPLWSPPYELPIH